MESEERQNILNQHAINDSDLFIFKWRLPQVLCEAPESWGALTDTELIIRCALKGFENKELQQDFLKGKPQNIYKAIIDEVAEDLVRRRVIIRDNDTIPYGDFEMNRYRIGPALNEERRQKITSIGLGNQRLFNELFPLQ